MSATDVFWAAAIPQGSVQIDLDAGRASLHVENLCVYDAFTVPNSIMGVNRPVNQVKGIFDKLHMEWSGISRRLSQDEPVNKMRGSFVENTRATIAVTATTPRTMMTALSNGHGFRFVSDPPSTSVSHFAEIGQEANGVYYQPGS